MLWALGIVLVLALLAYILIRLPAVQEFAREKVVTYLQESIGTKVVIKKLSVTFPKKIFLEGVYFEDMQGDTLLAGDTLIVDISMFKLLNNKVDINKIDLRGIHANIYRSVNNNFNFDYIVDSLSSGGAQKSDSPPMEISLGKIRLDRVAFKFIDDLNANDMIFYVGHFETHVKKFNLQEDIYEVGKVVLKNSSATISQRKPLAEAESLEEDVEESVEPVKLDIKVGEVDLENISLLYNNVASNIRADAAIGKLIADPEKIELKENIIDLKEIRLENSSIALVLGQSPDNEVVREEIEKEVKTESIVWNFSLDRLILKDNFFSFEDLSEPRAASGVDFSHLALHDIQFDAKNIVLQSGQLAALINAASLSEQKSGFVLHELKGDMFYGQKEAYARNLLLQTDSSRIDANLELSYTSRDSLLTYLSHIQQELELRESKIAISEVLLFAPSLRDEKFFQNYSSEIVTLGGNIRGRLDDLQIERFNISGLGKTVLELSGSVKGIPEFEHLIADVMIGNFETVREDMYQMFPQDVFPDYINIPASVRIRGAYEGGTAGGIADLMIQTPDGGIDIDGNFRWNPGLLFRGDMQVREVNIGKILRRDTLLGNLSLDMVASLAGNTMSDLEGEFSGRLESLELGGYNYHNFQFEGSVDTGTITANGIIQDDNLQLEFQANVHSLDAVPAVDFVMTVERARLKELHFADNELNVSATLRGDFASVDPDSLNGKLSTLNLIVEDSLRKFSMDSLTVIAEATSDSNTLKLQSSFLNLEMHGQYTITELPSALTNSVNTYFRINADTLRNETPSQVVDFNATLQYSPLFSQIDSSIKNFAPLTLSGRYRSEEDLIYIEGRSENIILSSVSLDGLDFTVDSKNDKLFYQVSLESASQGNLELGKTNFDGSVSEDRIFSNLTIMDEAGNRQFLISGTVGKHGSGFQFNLNPDSLILDYSRWQADEGNSIITNSRGILVEDLVLQREGQLLSITTEPPEFNGPLRVEFSNFRIRTITGIISRDSLLVGGTIHGSALVRNYTESPEFNANIQIKDFSFKEDTVGNIDLQVSNQSSNILTVDMQIEGYGNRLGLNGQYFIDNQGVDMTVSIQQMHLASIEGFALGTISEAEGIVRGDLDVKGTVFEPVVAGDLQFDSAGVRITSLDAKYILKNEGMSFHNSDLRFNDFTLTDDDGNTLDVNGVIFTKSFSNYRFDLDIRSDNFKVLDTDSRDNELYYGKLILDSHIRVEGPLNSPVIDADISILENTKMTVVIPQESPGIVEREGVVLFIDLDNPALDSVLSQSLDSLNTFDIRGITAFATIKVNEESEFKLVIDQGSGDFLRVRGDAELNASIDRSGKVSLTGNYVLEEGIYELSFNFLKRRFNIEEGSTITWNGAPTSGRANVKAVYVVEAPPIDLVERQLASATQTEINYYKERLPFELILNLTGELINPQVSFDIELPEGNYPVAPEVITTVEAKLQQLSRDEAELNKQAFALVLLNRFISDNPLKSASGGTTPESYARQSASKLLSQQLNNLAGDLISGVDLRFDIESTEDYSTGQLQNRTDLNVSASKRLLNDRVKVTIGSNFELEGAAHANENSTNIAGDIMVEYQLSKGGRYFLKAYRKNDYQVAVEGQVIETGISFVINLDYDKFMEIFRKSRETNDLD